MTAEDQRHGADGAETRRDDDEAMAVPPADADPVAGMLIVRVWREGAPGDPRLRARLVGRRRIGDDEQEIGASGSIEDLLAQTRTWLEDFLVD